MDFHWPAVMVRTPSVLDTPKHRKMLVFRSTELEKVYSPFGAFGLDEKRPNSRCLEVFLVTVRSIANMSADITGAV